MERIVIFGNSGSGKTHLGRALGNHFGYRLIHLDALFWESGGFNTRRSEETVDAEIANLRQNQTWIAEGVFGRLAQEFCPYADYLIWLDLDWETCSQSLLQRGSESSKQLDKQSAEENFEKLLFTLTQEHILAIFLHIQTCRCFQSCGSTGWQMKHLQRWLFMPAMRAMTKNCVLFNA